MELNDSRALLRKPCTLSFTLNRKVQLIVDMRRVELHSADAVFPESSLLGHNIFERAIVCNTVINVSLESGSPLCGSGKLTQVHCHCTLLSYQFRSTLPTHDWYLFFAHDFLVMIIYFIHSQAAMNWLILLLVAGSTVWHPAASSTGTETDWILNSDDYSLYSLANHIQSTGILKWNASQ